MSTKTLLDPELLPLLDVLPATPFSEDSLPERRQRIEELLVLGDAAAEGVKRDEISVPGLDGDPDIRCLRYQPFELHRPAPAYLHLHGGGYTAGRPEMGDEWNTRIAADLGAMVLSVDYRLAPENPVPAALNDAYAALGWLHQNADGLGIDPARVAVGGESAGGGLAAALAQRARDERRFPIRFQLLVYPMLDDRTGTEEVPAGPNVGEFVWTAPSNQFGWAAYFGSSPRSAPCAPARAASLAGLPATWMATAMLDLFLDENIAYARRLIADGVATELQVYPSACHGFQLIRHAGVSRRFGRDFFEALRRGLAID